MNKARMGMVVRALREARDKTGFDMSRYVHGCGTPACALGFYAASELQDLLDIQVGGYGLVYRDSGFPADWTDRRVIEHFDSTSRELADYFSLSGRVAQLAHDADSAANVIEGMLSELEPQETNKP